MIGPRSTSTGMSISAAAPPSKCRPVVEDQPSSRRLELDRPAARQDRGQEAVGAGEAEDDLAVLDRELGDERAVRTALRHVPLQVGAHCETELLSLDPRPPGDSQDHDPRRSCGARRLDARAKLPADLHARRRNTQVRRRQQLDRRVGLEGPLGLRDQGRRLPDGERKIETVAGPEAQYGLNAGNGIGGGPDIDDRDAQDWRRPGLHEGEVADAPEQRGEPLEQQVPVEACRAPAVQVLQDVDRILNECGEPVEAERPAYVRRCRGCCGLWADLDDAEEREQLPDHRLLPVEVAGEHEPEQPLRQLGGERLDLNPAGPCRRGDRIDPYRERVDRDDRGLHDRHRPRDRAADPNSVLGLDRGRQLGKDRWQVAQLVRDVADRGDHGLGAEHCAGRGQAELGEQDVDLAPAQALLERL